jgi:hypothetical protein
MFLIRQGGGTKLESWVWRCAHRFGQDQPFLQQGHIRFPRVPESGTVIVMFGGSTREQICLCGRFALTHLLYEDYYRMCAGPWISSCLLTYFSWRCWCNRDGKGYPQNTGAQCAGALSEGGMERMVAQEEAEACEVFCCSVQFAVLILGLHPSGDISIFL